MADMNNDKLSVDSVLKYYNELLKVKPNHLQTKYPYIEMDEGEIIETMKEIEMTYQNIQKIYTDNNRPRVRVGGNEDGIITVFAM